MAGPPTTEIRPKQLGRQAGGPAGTGAAAKGPGLGLAVGRPCLPQPGRHPPEPSYLWVRDRRRRLPPIRPQRAQLSPLVWDPCRCRFHGWAEPTGSGAEAPGRTPLSPTHPRKTRNMPNPASRPPAPSTNLTRRKRHCGSALAPRSRATDLGVAFLGEPTAGPQLTRGGLREVRFRSWWGRTGPWSSHAVPHRHGADGDHGGAQPRLPPPATPGPQHGAEGLVYPPSNKGQVRGGGHNMAAKIYTSRGL